MVNLGRDGDVILSTLKDTNMYGSLKSWFLSGQLVDDEIIFTSTCVVDQPSKQGQTQHRSREELNCVSYES